MLRHVRCLAAASARLLGEPVAASGVAAWQPALTVLLSLALQVQTERAYQKQAGVQTGFHARKGVKKVGKAGVRYHKNVGLGFKTPAEAISGESPDGLLFSSDTALRKQPLSSSADGAAQRFRRWPGPPGLPQGLGLFPATPAGRAPWPWVSKLGHGRL